MIGSYRVHVGDCLEVRSIIGMREQKPANDNETPDLFGQGAVA